MWATPQEKQDYIPELKRDRKKKYSEIQFYTFFAYGLKGDCQMYYKLIEQEIKEKHIALAIENEERAARKVLTQISALQVNEYGQRTRIKTKGKGPSIINKFTAGERQMMDLYKL